MTAFRPQFGCPNCAGTMAASGGPHPSWGQAFKCITCGSWGYADDLKRGAHSLATEIIGADELADDELVAVAVVEQFGRAVERATLRSEIERLRKKLYYGR